MRIPICTGLEAIAISLAGRGLVASRGRILIPVCTVPEATAISLNRRGLELGKSLGKLGVLFLLGPDCTDLGLCANGFEPIGEGLLLVDRVGLGAFLLVLRGCLVFSVLCAGGLTSPSARGPR